MYENRNLPVSVSRAIAKIRFDHYKRITDYDPNAIIASALADQECTTGIDLSRYQPAQYNDYDEIFDDGADFAFFKVSQNNWIDVEAENHYQGFKAARIMMGGYHFFEPARSPITQAVTFSNWLNDHPDWNLPPVLDLEYAQGKPNATIIANAHAFLVKVKELTSCSPIIYTSPGFWNTFMLINGGAPAWVKDYHLWEAAWPSKAVCGIWPYMPKGFTADQFKFWQFTAKGQNKGVHNGGVDVDTNWFRGTRAQLIAYAEKYGRGYQPDSPPVPPDPEPDSERVKLIKEIQDRFTNVFVDFVALEQGLVEIQAELEKISFRIDKLKEMES